MTDSDGLEPKIEEKNKQNFVVIWQEKLLKFFVKFREKAAAFLSY